MVPKGSKLPDDLWFRWLEFAAFSVKSREMNFGGDGIIGWRRSGWLLSAVILAALLSLLGQTGARAQLFSDRPPPVPPAAVPDPGNAVSLAPPSGPGAAPSLPPTLTQPASPALPPSVSIVPPAA